MLIYSMSDIHGFLEAFQSALKKVDLSGENKIVFLGDYIDYGPQSREVLESIMHLQKKYGANKVVVLLGNHEKDFLDWLTEYEDINIHIAKIDTYSKCEWLQQERDCDYETLKSFLSQEHWKAFSATEHILSWDSRNAEAVRLLLEDADEIITWLRGCLYYYETDNQIFVHAGIAEWAKEEWLCVTSDDLMVRKYPASKGTFYKDVIAGHISTARISKNNEFYGVLHDGESHYYLDGTTYRSGKVPVLVYDTEEKIYFEK
ncbi:MAG: metallophosphoesterase [Alphaproteobacteria bacterium]|nr:metallophosphoesterase [Alphaproteobacteria bacterium]MBQ3514129.1 metallophosphoesterase [Lachnospiraceae bacterium]